jgi:DNA-binding CsgD family transcriptional regulator
MRTFALIALALTLIIAGALILFSKHKREHLYKNSRILSQKHNSKDSYIRQMLSLYAQQITALDDYNRLVGRKIKASQATDMLRIAESGTVVNEQIEKFHNLFDNAFLSLHPDFINKVNELMLEDRKFTTPSSGLLNTELRYLAFMNLGVDDYQQIAIFLGITQNSVYTYKNKLKSRAENRDKFEENIVNLY